MTRVSQSTWNGSGKYLFGFFLFLTTLYTDSHPMLQVLSFDLLLKKL